MSLVRRHRDEVARWSFARWCLGQEPLRAYRRIWGQVTAVGRVVALDMPGFGHSDQPEELIAPRRHGILPARLIDEWDLGAPLMSSDPTSGRQPHSSWPQEHQEKGDEPDTRRWSRHPSRSRREGHCRGLIEAPSLDDVRQLDARVNISAADESAAPQPRARGARGLRERLRPGTVRRTARFVRHYPMQNQVLQDLLSSIRTPAQVVAGDHDDIVPWSNNQYLADTLPNSGQAHALDAGHSPCGGGRERVWPPRCRMGRRRL